MLRHAVRRAAATARALQAQSGMMTGRPSLSVPSSTSDQARYLRDLNRNDPEAVVRLYEQGKVAASEGNLAEYLKVRP